MNLLIIILQSLFLTNLIHENQHVYLPHHEMKYFSSSEEYSSHASSNENVIQASLPKTICSAINVDNDGEITQVSVQRKLAASQSTVQDYLNQIAVASIQQAAFLPAAKLLEQAAALPDAFLCSDMSKHDLLLNDPQGRIGSKRLRQVLSGSLQQKFSAFRQVMLSMMAPSIMSLQILKRKLRSTESLP
ncbi:hypothetical protein K431DRAFT_284394 [Polychaeton citri CBS 116435]|uniref:Uncharacterized protein n=1 Tax=Polychaeton citri CBS 116435 TaxID=1314669 RepID=A0A9P4Q7B8_9PEZI|nr:hypothetical protein K431DRAFT_284394 [Polychaeton citri CBS 116435]